MHSFNHISYQYMLILWLSASTEWVAFLISSPLLYYGCWRHLSQRNPSHMPRLAVRPKTVRNGALNKSIRAKSDTAWTTVMAWAETWRQLAQSSKGKLMRQLAFFPERYSRNKSAITSDRCSFRCNPAARKKGNRLRCSATLYFIPPGKPILIFVLHIWAFHTKKRSRGALLSYAKRFKWSVIGAGLENVSLLWKNRDIN